MPLEHVNVTVSDAKATAEVLCRIFGWSVRWEGASIHQGYSVHVGDKGSYLALYEPATPPEPAPKRSYDTRSGLNHLGVVVSDLDTVEERVKAEGYETNSHADYEPGRRFYFYGPDGIEYEAVEYD